MSRPFTKSQLWTTLSLISLAGVCFAGWQVLKAKRPETHHATYTAPDGSFKVLVTVTREHWPYGVEGNVYITSPDEKEKRRVSDYFVDFLDDSEMRLEWDVASGAFAYRGKSSGPIFINLINYPLNAEGC